MISYPQNILVLLFHFSFLCNSWPHAIRFVKMSSILEIRMEIWKYAVNTIITLSSHMLEVIFLRELRWIISKPYSTFITAQNLNNLKNLFQAQQL